MPGSNHHGLVPRASNTNRGQHPDIDPASGEPLWDTHLPVAQRDFARLRRDPQRWQAFYDGVAQQQMREHPDVQEAVAGRYYDGNGDPLQAYQDYQSDLSWARRYTGRDKEITSWDVENHDLDWYNERFDEHGRPREGYSFRATSRDIVTDTQSVDPYSRDELQRRARDPR
jgi:hypothetical protein